MNVSVLRRWNWLCLLGTLLVSTWESVSQNAPEVIREALVIESLGRAGRNTLFTDALESQIVAGTWEPPQAGQVITLADGRQRTWTNAVANTNDWFSGPAMRGGYLYFAVNATEPRVVLLNASGHNMAYVNGEPRAGDLYQYGYVQSPVLLRPGRNDFLLVAGRGRLRASLLTPRAPVSLNLGDPTVPDLILGQPVRTSAAVIVINATTNWQRDLSLTAEWSGQVSRTLLPALPPLTTRKVAFQIEGPAPAAAESGTVTLSLISGGATLDEQPLTLRIRRPDQPRKQTFVSGIDGSLQYFAVNPGQGFSGPPALFLSLHGASVEGIGQAESYAPKRNGHVVSPTNRRPYGFDWEEWGRLDALEVLDLATAQFSPDPSRIYLTGHSMGGHGTWSLGATFPDRFAAVGPSAGWISFFSYGGTNPYTNATPVEAILRRASASSDTLALLTNFLHLGVYVIHGDADDNVPVREARRMREELGRFHRDVAWYEQPGAGHWWDASDEPGADCVDWAPMFDFFNRHRIPADYERRQIHFVTVNPGVSSRSHWLGIEGQMQALEPSDVQAQWDPGQQRVSATTRNVRRLVLETASMNLRPGTGLQVEVDGQKLENLQPDSTVPSLPYFPGQSRPWQKPVRLAKDGDRWVQATAPNPLQKTPARYGPFKDAFRHRFLFVYGTHGTPEENAWAFQKARFDAESFWYRGNGSIEILPDTEFDPVATRDRGVILYGNRDSNSAWPLLLAESPIQVRRGEVRIGDRVIARSDLACLFLQPRRDSAFASVGVVSGSGVQGMRLTQRLPYFLAGTGYPDCLVVSPKVLQEGTAGIVTAGFFGPDWMVNSGQFAWTE